MNKTFAWVAVILGIVFAVLAVLYWMTPADSLPMYLPGYDAGSTVIHFKHGIASLILALALLAFAWFKSAPPRN